MLENAGRMSDERRRLCKPMRHSEDPFAAAAMTLLAQPEAQEAVTSAAMTASEVQELPAAVITTLQERARTSAALESRLQGLRESERSLEIAWDDAMAEAAQADPQSFGPRLQLQRLQEEQTDLVQKERALRQEIETLRAQIGAAKASEVVEQGADGRRRRREVEKLEAQYLSRLEALQRLKTAIVHIVQSKKSLEMRLPALEREARAALLASGDTTPVARALEHVEEQQRLTGEAIADSFKSQIEDVVHEAVAHVHAAKAEEAAAAEAVRASLELDSRSPSELTPVTGSDGETETDFELNLQRRMAELKVWTGQHRRRAELTVVAGCVVLALLGVLLIFGNHAIRLYSAAYLLPIAAALFILGAQARQRRRSAAEEIADIEHELELLHIEQHQPERRAQKMLQVNQLDLRRYYDQTLRHARLIFYFGIACIGLGFGGAAAALLLVTNADPEVSEQIIVASLGAVSAILANFIGLIYLRMFSEITGSVSSFHTRLVGTHDLYFSNFLAAKVSTPAVREQLFAEMARDVGRTRHGGVLEGTSIAGGS
jgi:hypothetical protein